MKHCFYINIPSKDDPPTLPQPVGVVFTCDETSVVARLCVTRVTSGLRPSAVVF